jgi:hypothetical protein
MSAMPAAFVRRLNGVRAASFRGESLEMAADGTGAVAPGTHKFSRVEKMRFAA